MRAVGGRDVRGSDVEQDDWGLEVRPVVVVSAELSVYAVWCPVGGTCSTGCKAPWRTKLSSSLIYPDLIFTVAIISVSIL